MLSGSAPNIIKSAAAVAGLAGLVAVSAPTEVSSAELKLASFTGPKHAMNRAFFTPWAKEVDKASNGTLKVKMFVGGKLGKGGARQFKRALDRVADITFGLQGYTSNQFRATTLIELPGIAGNAVEATRAMWAAWDGHLEKEYKDVKMLFMWSVDRPVIMTKNKQVKSIADLKGMKIRTPSQAQAKTIQALGAIPVPMPITKVYNAMSRGLLDGVLTSTTTLTGFKLKEVTKYFAAGLPWGTSPMFLVMNKDAYNGLSAAHKAIIDKTTGAKPSERGGAVYDKESEDGFNLVRNSKNHVLFNLPASEVKEGTALLMKAGLDIIAETNAKGVNADAIVAKMRAAN
ncbi:MAG: TRAP transporter substrate-binding protein [Rhodospirillaceae bacterium]|nr:TRAP transporter substrate-binding protein [Rhodospirillaceae bacterium]MBT7571893.1 TRAP transporter substrate-binding protein [Rhodospirillaceae bacterium]